MPTKILRIATRKSPLALWQAQFIAETLVKQWPKLQVELVPMLTSGDKFLKDKLLTVGGKGLFVKELEEALLNDRADIAVHSMKDVPATFPEGLALAAICLRENPFDAFLSQTYTTFSDLPQKARIGTSSLRRQSQLLAIRPDLQVLALRGNIQTRIAKLDAGEFDAIILAAAGLFRMNLTDRIQQIITDDIMLPACGQGALGIECRVDDHDIQSLLAPLNDPTTAACVYSERRVNALLGGNCHVPLAVYCQPLDTTRVTLRAKVASADGQQMISNEQQGLLNDAIHLADRCAQELLTNGAKKLLAI